MMKVAIVMGSKSDLPIMEEAAAILKQFDISYEVRILSAHRTPEKVTEFSTSAMKQGFSIIIAGAGMAAHLAGVIAAHTTLPVIGVPIDSSSLGGIDSLLSTVQMPPGIPVAAVGLGKSGAKNAALLALEILALSSAPLRKKLLRYRDDMKKSVLEADSSLKAKC
jgi:phosphoribosylaminoimidazole carboxylase PurE protein